MMKFLIGLSVFGLFCLPGLAQEKSPAALEALMASFTREARAIGGRWTRFQGDYGPELHLRQASPYRPRWRSPQAWLRLGQPLEGDFDFEVEARQTGPEYAHRDLVLVFAARGVDHFAYAHLSTRADENAHHLMLVDGADRRPITKQRSRGVDWGRGAWRKIVMQRRGDRVRVWFDGAPQPVLEGELRAWRQGYLGLGSFDDTGAFRHIRIRATAIPSAPVDFDLGAARDAVSTERFGSLTEVKRLAPPSLPLKTRRLSADGGWCWFEGPAARMHDDKLVVGSIPSGWLEAERRGDVELLIHDPKSERSRRIELADRLQLDDHNQPALLPTADGRLLAVFSRHGNDSLIRSRRSLPGDLSRWEAPRQYRPSPSSRVTYSNLMRPDPKGPIYNFFRGLDGSWKPSFVVSEDEGQSWRRGGIAIDVPGEVKHRPYVRYASDDRGRMHLVYTEGHPRNFDNSLYHVVIDDGQICASDGRPLAPLAKGLSRPDLGTRIFQGSADAVAWVADVVADPGGGLRVLFTTQRDGAGLPPKKGGLDHRFHLARYLNGAWTQREIAPAGTRLYAGEDDYTGLGALDPRDPLRLVISSDAQVLPQQDEPKPMTHELYEGRLSPGGWIFERLTNTPPSPRGGAPLRNLRPILVDDAKGRQSWLLWLRGRYRSYGSYEQEVLAAPMRSTRLRGR
jgi:BNR repeat-containing family member